MESKRGERYDTVPFLQMSSNTSVINNKLSLEGRVFLEILTQSSGDSMAIVRWQLDLNGSSSNLRPRPAPIRGLEKSYN